MRGGELSDSARHVESYRPAGTYGEKISTDDGAHGVAFYLGGHCHDRETIARRGAIDPTRISFLRTSGKRAQARAVERWARTRS